MKADNVVKAHVEMQSRAETGLARKLIYRARGPFIITQELYLLPPALFLSEILDTMDEQCLDCNHTHVVSPLLKSMRVELFNNKWLQPGGQKVQTHFQHVNLPSSEIDALVFKPHAYAGIPTVSDLHVNKDILPII